MGIQGLERYIMTTHPDTCPTVRIADLASKYRAATGREEAVTVVDGGILMFHVMGGLDLRYGGQFKEFAGRIVAFGRRLQGVGVTPVFYLKGAPSEGRLNVWADRKRTEQERVLATYDSLASWTQHKDRDRVKNAGEEPKEPARSLEGGKEEPAGEAGAASADNGSAAATASAAADAAAKGDDRRPKSAEEEQEKIARMRADLQSLGLLRPGGRGGRSHSDSAHPRGQGDSRRGDREGRGGGVDRGVRGDFRGQRPPRPAAGGHNLLLPPGTHQCATRALKEAGFQVLVSTGELDVEMARYCRLHGCFALLSRDSDFVAMESAHYYLSVSHLDPKAMTTVHFDRDAIAKALGLRARGQLPLLMALLPNACVPKQYLIPLHHRAAGGRYAELSPSLQYRLEAVLPRLGSLVCTELWGKSAADAVQAILAKALAVYPQEVLNRYSVTLGFRDRWGLREALRGQLEASLRAHDYAPPEGTPLPPPTPPAGTSAPAAASAAQGQQAEVLAAAKERHATLQFATPSVLVLLTHRLIEQTPVLEDPGLPERCSSTEALRPFRRRVYGVLLQPQKDEDEDEKEVLPEEGEQAVCKGGATGRGGLAVREFIAATCIIPKGSKARPVDVEAVVPDAAVTRPSLLSLWRGGEGVADAQWRLLSWCLCPSRAVAPQPGGDAADDALVAGLRALPPRLVLPAAALFLMRHTGALAASIRASPAAELAAARARSHAAGEGSSAVAAATAAVAEAKKAVASGDTTIAALASATAALEDVTAALVASLAADRAAAAAAQADQATRTPEEMVRLIATTCVLAESMTAADVARLPAPRPVRLAVHLAALFMRTWNYVCVLNDVLGAPVPVHEVHPARVFDGKVFHCLLAESLPHDADAALVEAVVRIAGLGDGDPDAPCDVCRCGPSGAGGADEGHGQELQKSPPPQQQQLAEGTGGHHPAEE